ncbi:MAG: hypothetical protein E6J41_23500 [Chloroflexi bacterium]|nr:MAG: hypothetical protein E6J41_23500 [Chloroflexota bacterium]
MVNFKGIDPEMNVIVLRLALVRRQVAGEFDSMDQIVDAIGSAGAPSHAPSQARDTGLTVALAVLDMKFEEVFRPINHETA